MFQVQQLCTGGWCPVEQGNFRSVMKAVTAARYRTAQQGSDHRIVDLSLKAVVEVVAEGSIQQAPNTQLRSGCLRESTRELDELGNGMRAATPPNKPPGRRLTHGMPRLAKHEQM
jgi:hypothetical protein